jgi:hypothetical protein
MSSNYSIQERMIASTLSKFPGIKRAVKRIYGAANAFVYKKKYKVKLNQTKAAQMTPVVTLKNNQESFFGYYDKFPMNNESWVLSHISNSKTSQNANSKSPIGINVTNISTGKSIEVGTSCAFNWQQGARLQWLTSDLFIYNDFQDGKYVSKVYSLCRNTEVKVFDSPVQDSFQDKYLLSLNYRRLYTLTDDYGYDNLPKLNKTELEDLQNDGIFKIDFETGASKLIYSLDQIVNCDYKSIFKESIHSVNHIMINNAGTAFIFIHRYYKNGIRYDRLMYADFKQLKVLVDKDMVSHCYWMTNTKIIGYLRYDNQNAYFEIDTLTNEITLNQKMSELQIGDGHPNASQNQIVFDSYPNKSRMQKLFLYDNAENKVDELMEVFNGLSYQNQSRCDLHPRFNKEEKILFFDTVFENGRKHFYIKLK